MSGILQQNKSSITVKGSAEIVCEYLDFGINSILFQRGIYPPEDFKTVENYGLPIYMSQDNKIKDFLSSTFSQLKDWLIKRLVNKIALIITNVNTYEVMERWDFNVQYEDQNNDDPSKQSSDKPLKQIKNEIRDVLKQIASSVTYLPLLDCLCSFDIQIYTKNNIELPPEWADAKPADIKNAQCVKLRSFSTNIHKMDTVVTYKNDD